MVGDANWETMRLGDAAVVMNGKTPSKGEQRTEGHPVLKIRDVNETSEFRGVFQSFVDPSFAAKFPHKQIRPGDTLILNAAHNADYVASKTFYAQEATLGALATGEWLVVRPKEEFIDGAFLRHWVNSPRTRRELRLLVNGIHLYPKDVAKLQISVPALAEQKRVAAILNKADAIRRRRQSSLLLVDEFLRSLFLSMFGDAQVNPKGWPIQPLQNGVLGFEGGKNFMPTETERRDGVRVLKVSAVTSGEYQPSQSKSFSQSEIVDPRHMVREGDLLISRANTAELVGAVAYVWSTSGKEMLPDKLWRFVWPEHRTLEPLFVLHLARSPYFRRELISRATGSSGSMKNIGKSKMLEIPIPFPPVELQKTFARAVSALQKLAGASKEALNQADQLFHSLQQRAFNGDLSR
jgi:type I restriction enzyme S subunit